MHSSVPQRNFQKQNTEFNVSANSRRFKAINAQTFPRPRGARLKREAYDAQAICLQGKILIRTEGGGGKSNAHLTGRAVGEAGFVVGRQIKIRGTGTFVFPAGGQETQVAASSIRNLTLVLGNYTEDRST